MNLDQICQMTKNPQLLNALHSCREGHPWNVPGVNHWANAFALAAQRPSYEIPLTATGWLSVQADKWDREHAQ